MYKIIIFLILGLAFNVLGQTTHPTDTEALQWRVHMQQGDVFLNAGDLLTALGAYEYALQIMANAPVGNVTDEAKCHVAIGGIKLDLRTKETAIALQDSLTASAFAHIQYARSLDSNHTVAYLLLGNAYFYQNQFEQAIQMYEKCLEKDAGDADAAKNLALAYQAGGRYAGEHDGNMAKAVQLLRKAYELNPQDVETLRLLGVAYGSQAAPSEALSWFEKGAEIDPNNASIWWNMHLAHTFLGHKTAAQRCRKKAIALDPSLSKK